MPIYEFQCKSCCHTFERLVFKTDDTTPACPQCGHEETERLISCVSISGRNSLSCGGGGTTGFS